MLVLLGVLPYIGSVTVYLLTARDVLSVGEGEVPSSWNWKLVVPVLLGALTPLALAASDALNGTERGFLVSVFGIGSVFSVVAMTALRDDSKFFSLQQPVSIGRAKLTNVPRWKVLVGIGAIILCYGAVVNVVVARDVDKGSRVAGKAGQKP